MVSTRIKSHVPHQQEEQSDVASHTECLGDRRRRWSSLVRKQYYQPVVSEILDQELLKYQHSTIINITDRVSHLRECALILASVSSVFTAAMEGDLVSRLLTDNGLQRDHDYLQERAHDQPSIYIHLLADELGYAPTPNQYLIIRAMVLDYLMQGAASNYAWDLDNITPPSVASETSAQGHRKYLNTKSRSSKREQILYRFCQGILTRCLQTPTHLHDTPFQHPPGECGYSKNAHARLAQHRAHHSSNYVMNLVEDICTYLHRSGTFKQHFRMHQFIIYLIFRPSQAAIAEIFCSALLQVWIDDGGGFNAYPAGRSVVSAQRVSVDEWDAHEIWVRGTSPVVKNMRRQQEMAREWAEALEWEGDSAEDVAIAAIVAHGEEDSEDKEERFKHN